MTQRIVLLLAALIATPAAAQDLKDRVNFRIGVSGMYLREDQPGEKNDASKIAGPLQLAYGDLRAVLDARRLPGNFELHLDGRVRLTSQLEVDNITQGNGDVSARGYLGGREYQIYEIYARGRWKKFDFGIGRLVVPEADALRIDGLRFWIHASRAWDVSVYAGGYPDPYSRSVLTDYVTGDTPGAGLAFVGGASARYTYERIFGSFSANGAYLGGNDDGGPVQLTTDPTTMQPALVPTTPKKEKVRAYLTWTNFWRPVKYIDLYHDLVVDVAGAAGVQLTRLNAFIAGHVHKNVTIRAGYDHMSSIAIEMYLARLLNTDRTQFNPAAIENNLTISRTGRDEGRLAIEGQIGATTITGEGRLGRRVLINPQNDVQFVYPTGTPNAGEQIAPSLTYDATLSVRNRGSLWALRPSLWVTYLQQYRARNIYVGAGIGRDFFRDRLSLDLGFVYANTRDDQVANAPGCISPGPVTPLPQLTQLQGCFGTRKGHNAQPFITLTANPAKHWFILFDYRAGVAISEGSPLVLTTVVLARVEARY